MVKNLLQSLTVAALALCVSAPAFAQTALVSEPASQAGAVTPKDLAEGETPYTYAPDGTNAYYGTGVKETSNMAIFIDGTAIAGAKVVGLRFELSSSAVNNSGRITGWTTTELKHQGRYNIPTGEEVALSSKAEGWNEIRFSEPIEITSEGLYVGYSVIASSANCYAIATGANTAPSDRCFVFCPTGIGSGWREINTVGMPALSMQAILTGITPGGMGIAAGGEFDGAEGRFVLAVAGEPVVCDITAYNRTTTEVTSVEYTYEIGGVTGSNTISTSLSAAYGAATSFSIELPAMPEVGKYDLSVTVTKVNGVENSEVDATATATVVVTPNEVKHRPIVEEYTGTWCGYCPRGYIGMLRMNEEFPEDFVGIAYHNGDPMDASNVVEPNSVSGYPSGIVDRNTDIDPNYDEILSEWSASASRSTSMGIDVAAEFSADESTIEVTASVTPLVDISDGDYTIGYILVADGLSGTGSSWNQSNYYSGNAYIDEYWAVFTEGGSSVSGLVFDDVAVLAPHSRGVDGSLPASLTALETYTHNYSFTVADAVNSSNQLIIQDKSKLRVMAVILDGSGNAINANKVSVPYTSSVGNLVAPSSDAVEVARYTLDGRQISEPVRGVNIVKMSDGTARKVIVK